MIDIGRTPARAGVEGSPAPTRSHSLIDLEREREPSLAQLRRERDDPRHLSDAIIEMAVNRVRILVSERNGWR